MLSIVRLCEHVTCIEQDIVNKNHMMYVCVCEAKSHRMYVCVRDTRYYERKETEKREMVSSLPVDVLSTFPFCSSFYFNA